MAFHGFVYKPFDRSLSEIRLIKLLPASDGKTISHCTIEHVDYRDSPPYKALSYIWGNPDATRPIAVNGMELRVTTNLVTALRYLRDLFCKQDALTLWVDAICINQKDKLERGHQVQLMKDIYSKAQMGILWTGELGEDGAAAMDMIQSLSSKELDENDTRTWNSVPALRMIDNWKAVNTYFEGPFWSRVWILQEFLLASSLLLVYGDRILDY